MACGVFVRFLFFFFFEIFQFEGLQGLFGELLNRDFIYLKVNSVLPRACILSTTSKKKFSKNRNLIIHRNECESSARIKISNKRRESCCSSVRRIIRSVFNISFALLTKQVLWKKRCRLNSSLIPPFKRISWVSNFLRF
jgi:hypothetical protein